MNAGIINTVKFITRSRSVAVAGDGNNILCVRWAHQDKEDFLGEVAHLTETLAKIGNVTLNDEYGAEARVEIIHEPDSYFIAEWTDPSQLVYTVLQGGYDVFEDAQDAIKNVKRRRTVKDPKSVVILGAWLAADDTEIDEPLDLPRAKDFVIDGNDPVMPDTDTASDEPDMATDDDVAGLSPSSEWVSFAKAAQILAVRYQQVYQRAVMRNRMRYMNHYSENDVKGHLYTHIEDVRSWEDERQQRLIKAMGAVEVADADVESDETVED